MWPWHLLLIVMGWHLLVWGSVIRSIHGVVVVSASIALVVIRVVVVWVTPTSTTAPIHWRSVALVSAPLGVATSVGTAIRTASHLIRPLLVVVLRRLIVLHGSLQSLIGWSSLVPSWTATTTSLVVSASLIV